WEEMEKEVSFNGFEQAEKKLVLQEEETKREDIEMNGKESRQGSTIEERERQKRRRQEVEREIDIVGIPLEESMWAPNRRNCNKNSSLLANILAHNVPGKTEEERTKFIKWSLKNNKHIKNIQENFKRGNLWIEVEFDCEYGRNEAIQKISRKESDWYKMIPEENEEKRKEKEKKCEEEHLKERNIILQYEKRRHERKRKEEMREESQKKSMEESKDPKYLTIWNLPANINRKEIEYMCRRFKEAHIVRIKRSKYKSLAIVQVEKSEEGNISWSIPVDKNKLVRVTKGIEDYEAREKQKQYTAKLTELPSNASEVLLLRCLRSKGAKSVHIPPNRNGNQRRTATIIFATEEEVKAAQSKPIMYNNFRVYWTSEKNKEARRKE